jgi:hypothetical protein
MAQGHKAAPIAYSEVRVRQQAARTPRKVLDARPRQMPLGAQLEDQEPNLENRSARTMRSGRRAARLAPRVHRPTQAAHVPQSQGRSTLQ